jgi:hypothetical protein
MDSLVCMIYGFVLGFFTGTLFNAKSVKESVAAFLYLYARYTHFAYMFLMFFVLRLILWKFIIYKMKGERCPKTSVILSVSSLMYIFFFASRLDWMGNVAYIGATFSVFWAFREALFLKEKGMFLSYPKPHFYPEDIFFVIILMAVALEILFIFPWNKSIVIRAVSYILVYLIFFFVLRGQIPHNDIWMKELKDTSLFAPRNCLGNCFVLFLLESCWAGWEMSYGTGLEVITLSQISVLTLLFLVILRKEDTQ